MLDQQALLAYRLTQRGDGLAHIADAGTRFEQVEPFQRRAMRVAPAIKLMT